MKSLALRIVLPALLATPCKALAQNAPAAALPDVCATFALSAPADAFEAGINRVCLIKKSSDPVFDSARYTVAPYTLTQINTQVTAVLDRSNGSVAFVADDDTMLLLQAGRAASL